MDIILTWPKARTLDSYLEALEEAKLNSEAICFRVQQPPKNLEEGDRVFMVHSGWVRGWNEFLGISTGPVMRVTDPVTKEQMPDGTYLVRDPEWHPLNKLVVKGGFRGFRYVQPETSLAIRLENAMLPTPLPTGSSLALPTSNRDPHCEYEAGRE